MATRSGVSVVIPCLNEAENLPKLYRELVKALKGYPHQLIFIDDGSSDNSLEVLKHLSAKDPTVEIVEFRRRFGQSAAMSCGFSLARYQVVVTLDADLQNNPADIPTLLEKLAQGYDMVCGWRQKRHDKKLTRTLPSKAANWLLSRIFGVKVHDTGCTLKAMKLDLVKELHLYGDMHRFLPVLANQIGANITEVVVDHRPRIAGSSKYGLGRVVRVMIDLMTLWFFQTYHTRPLHLFGGAGLVIGGAGSILFAGLSYERVVLLRPLADRPLFLVSIFLILIGWQLITVGLLAEMLVRIHYKSPGNKPYHIRTIWKA